MYDVVVIGASIGGSRTAELLAKRGRDVVLIEENTEIGHPLKCTGLVSWRVPDILPNIDKRILLNKVDKAKFFSPNGTSFMLKVNYDVYVISRPLLDKFLFKQAEKVGVKTKKPEKFEGFRKYKNGLKIKTNKSVYETKLLVGADGGHSTVAKAANIKQPEKFFIGVQTTAKGSFDPTSAELWFGSDIAPDFFAWSVPISESYSRIGLATYSNPKPYYERFLKMKIGRVLKPDVGGIIKTGLIEDSVADRVLLVGDAASQMKPFSGGGITYGLIASNYCAAACLEALKNRKYDHSFLKDVYDKRWKKYFSMPIRMGLFYRKLIHIFNDWQLNLLFNFMHISKIDNLFEKLDMDLL